MFEKIYKFFSKDLGIDLGTSNSLVYVKDKGIVIREPSIVAINIVTEEVIAIGDNAKKMLGKNPSHISILRPLKDGIISDFEVAEKMLKYFIDKVHKDMMIGMPAPKVIIAIPMEITEVERKAVEDAAFSAGAREVYLVEEAMAAAIGAKLPVNEPIGNMVVDIGGGTTEIAVISLDGIVTKRSLRIAGDELTDDIINYVRDRYNILIGDKTAEEIKIKLGRAYGEDNKEMIFYGRDLISGLPKEAKISSQEIKEAITKTLLVIVENIRNVIESTPPELLADVYKRGILVCGGGALLNGIDKLIEKEVKIKVRIDDDPLTVVVRGTGVILENLDLFKNILFIPS